MYYAIIPSNSDLMHHGIKGQKWGIRRFQNKDGSLTAAGKARNSEKKVVKDPTISLYEKVWNNDVEATLKYCGVSHLNSDTDIIKKGSKFHRITLEDEPLTDERKYVSITPYDGRAYKSDWEALVPGHNGDKVAEIEYTSDKEIKVATPKKVKEELDKLIGSTKVCVVDKESLSNFYGKKIANRYLKKYGDVTINQLSLDPAENYKNIYSKRESKKKMYSYKLDETYEIGSNFVRNSFDTTILDHNASSKIVESLKKQGYDAMVDINDNKTFDYPMILLSPKSSVKQTGVDRFTTHGEKLYELEIPIVKAKIKGLF